MKLSIALTTYNHEAFLASALDSIIIQDIQVPFEIVIGNDCSTDNTQIIIDEYKLKYPGLIRDLPRPLNMGYIRNFDDILRSCQGEYIAIFDGDDIMLPGKINLQITYLDNNLDCAIVGHGTRAFDSITNKTIEIISPKSKKAKYQFEDLVEYGSILANSSKMYRKSAYPKEGIDENIKLIADWYITLEIAKKGKIGYIDKVLVDYRVHKDSIMRKIKGQIHCDDILYILNKIERNYPSKFTNLFYRQKAYAYFAKGMQEYQEGQTRMARASYILAIKTDPFYGYNIYFKFIISFLPKKVINLIYELKKC